MKGIYSNLINMSGLYEFLGFVQRPIFLKKHEVGDTFFLGVWDYWHCGHSWPIVPASGDSEDDCGEQMECR
jgi:hypothetical protein